MLALLKLIPLRDYLWAALAVALLALLGWTYHKGEAHIEQKNAALTAASIALAAASDKLAETKEIQVGQTYYKYINQPIASVGLRCTAPASAQNPDKAPSGSDDSPIILQTGSFDPSGPILSLLSDADLTISTLQESIRLLQAQLTETGR